MPAGLLYFSLALLLVSHSAIARPQTIVDDEEGLQNTTTESSTDEPPSTDKPSTTPAIRGEGDEQEHDFTTIFSADLAPGDNSSSTTPDTNTTSTTESSTDTPSTASNSTETTTTTESTTSTTTTTTTTTGPSTNATVTAAPSTTPSPYKPDTGNGGGFDGWSFFGGIILAFVGFAIGFISLKYWKIRKGQAVAGGGGNYNRF
jgi:CD164 antigen